MWPLAGHLFDNFFWAKKETVILDFPSSQDCYDEQMSYNEHKWDYVRSVMSIKTTLSNKQHYMSVKCLDY